uniref:Uncharacterized protein n=1 Tax=Haptolina ericina TaxID=156174 RepID=A0A7S3AJK4_9EUKA|mmetsp:Transcript_20590/g.45986  ORF Transcript_20590/g.45986 Transcript_20590/m.45986 type:complete len:286 (+) Transcript_20590:3-860(+)
MNRVHQRRIISVQRIARHINDPQSSASHRKYNNTASSRTDIYQFGVFTGGGMKAWLDIFPKYNISFAGDIWGFDSFEGMPDENASDMMSVHARSAAWGAGGLNAAKLLNITSWKVLQAVLTRNIGYAAEKTHFLRGFYNESLANGAALARRLGMRPAFLLDIDCDLYTSATQALRFSLDAGLLVPGTFVYYDDVSAYDLEALEHPRMRNTSKEYEIPEELRAHMEISKEYGLRWRSTRNLGWYLGPVKGLEWIVQRPARDTGKWLAPQTYPPVVQLRSCERCSQS